MCSPEKNYGFSLKINCDAGAAQTTYDLDPESIAEDQCHPKVIMNSPAGCPVFSMPPLWRWASNNSVIIAVALVIMGISLIQFGGKHYMVSMCIVGAFLMTCIMMSILYGALLPASTP